MSKTARGDKSKINKYIITAAAIRHVLICPNQVAIILPRGDKSPFPLGVPLGGLDFFTIFVVNLSNELMKVNLAGKRSRVKFDNKIQEMIKPSRKSKVNIIATSPSRKEALTTKALDGITKRLGEDGEAD